MNAAIAQVVEGSKLAEHASDRMHQTEQRTSELVSLVQRIAVSSTEQAKVSNELLIRAADIRKNTEETSDKIEQASHQTNNLVEYARSLLGAVRVFKLPG
jgi:methyl-accepting chemotaxis protein